MSASAVDKECEAGACELGISYPTMQSIYAVKFNKQSIQANIIIIILVYDVMFCIIISYRITCMIYVVAEWLRRRAGSRLIASSNPTPARERRRPFGVAWMPLRTLMVEYINKGIFFL